MPTQSRPVIKTGTGADLAFAVVLLASYFATFSALKTPSTLEIVLMIVLGIAYVLIGIYGYGFCAASGSAWLQLVYFAIQIPLGGVIVYLARGGAFNALILLPLAGHSAMLLSRGWMAAANLGILASYLVGVGVLTSGWENARAGLPAFLAGQVFVVAFTQMAVNEEKARREVERLASQLKVVNQRLREYALQVEELAIAKERNRLAREIHDGVGHYLTTIHMQIQAARAVSASDPARAQEVLAHAQNLSQEALADIRRSVAALRSGPDESLPLPERIHKLLQNYEMSGLSIEMKVSGKPRRLSPQANLTIYRSVQEGLSNISRHAQASSVCILLDYTGAQIVRLSVQDNGQGSERFDGGFGLMGLRERVNLLEGEFEVSSAPGQGFCLRVGVPG